MSQAKPAQLTLREHIERLADPGTYIPRPQSAGVVPTVSLM
jgi:hypothetical protein